MKKYAIWMLVILLTGSAKAQVTTGFKVGANYSYAAVKSPEGETIDVTGGTGFHAGMQLRIPFDVDLYFTPQFQYAYKTFTVNYNYADTSSIAMKYHYLEIPLLLEYHPNIDDRGFFAQFGPSFSIAAAGTQVINSDMHSSSSEPIKFAFAAYGRFEANLVANLGYQFSPRLQATIGYAYGLGSIVDNDFGPSIKPRMATVSLHYWLPARSR